MRKSKFLALCLIVGLAGSIHTAAGQVINASVQNASSRAVPGRVAPAARPIANTSIAPHVASEPTGFAPRTFSSYSPRILGPSAPNLPGSFSPVVRTFNPTVAAMNAQRIGQIGEAQRIALDPATRARELRTLAAMRVRHGFRTENSTLASINPQRPTTTHDPMILRQPKIGDPRQDSAGTNWHDRNDHPNYFDAWRRHQHEWHDRDWWQQHCNTIVFVSSGYYFLDGSYWYPAWGYDPLQTYNDYDGPIYTYNNLLPDEAIANVQVALQDAGYYLGPITGSLDVETRAALANFQRDYGLPISGAVDEPTVETLGLYQTDSQFVTP